MHGAAVTVWVGRVSSHAEQGHWAVVGEEVESKAVCTQEPVRPSPWHEDGLDLFVAQMLARVMTSGDVNVGESANGTSKKNLSISANAPKQKPGPICWV